MIGLNKALGCQGEEGLLVPITNTLDVRLSDLVGYESQKQKLRRTPGRLLKARKLTMSHCLVQRHGQPHP